MCDNLWITHKKNITCRSEPLLVSLALTATLSVGLTARGGGDDSCNGTIVYDCAKM